jgi:iron complex transport system ATP-binding protein
MACARGPFCLRVASLQVGHGEKIVLLGENGSGKTTLLQALAGLLPVTGGSIVRDGTDWTGLDPAGRAAHMAYLPQNADVLFNLTVRELLDLALPDAGPRCDEAARRRALTATAMENLLHRPFHSLSGGEKRRAMLARALCRDRELLLLDEPTAPLDPRHSLRLMRHVRDCAATVIAAMHDIALALRFFERFLLMRQGRIMGDKRRNDLSASDLARTYGVDFVRCGDHFVPVDEP